MRKIFIALFLFLSISQQTNNLFAQGEELFQDLFNKNGKELLEIRLPDLIKYDETTSTLYFLPFKFPDDYLGKDEIENIVALYLRAAVNSFYYDKSEYEKALNILANNYYKECSIEIPSEFFKQTLSFMIDYHYIGYVLDMDWDDYADYEKINQFINPLITNPPSDIFAFTNDLFSRYYMDVIDHSINIEKMKIEFIQLYIPSFWKTNMHQKYQRKIYPGVTNEIQMKTLKKALVTRFPSGFANQKKIQKLRDEYPREDSDSSDNESYSDSGSSDFNLSERQFQSSAFYVIKAMVPWFHPKKTQILVLKKIIRAYSSTEDYQQERIEYLLQSVKKYSRGPNREIKKYFLLNLFTKSISNRLQEIDVIVDGKKTISNILLKLMIFDEQKGKVNQQFREQLSSEISLLKMVLGNLDTIALDNIKTSDDYYHYLKKTEKFGSFSTGIGMAVNTVRYHTYLKDDF